MTEFQQSCAVRLNRLFSQVEGMPSVEFAEKNIVASSFASEVANLMRRCLGLSEVPYAKKKLPETSLTANFRFKNHNFTIYIYESDAEIHRDDAASVFEQPDYASEDELVESLVNQVSDALLKDTFLENVQGLSISDFVTVGSILLLMLAVILGSILWVHNR